MKCFTTVGPMLLELSPHIHLLTKIVFLASFGAFHLITDKKIKNRVIYAVVVSNSALVIAQPLNTIPNFMFCS